MSILFAIYLAIVPMIFGGIGRQIMRDGMQNYYDCRALVLLSGRCRKRACR